MAEIIASLLIVLVLMIVGVCLPSTRGRQLLFLAASYVFYANWGIGFLSVLIISSLINYIWGRALQRRRTAARLWVGIALNVVPLFFFKYLPEIGPAVPWHYNFLRHIVMPVGISYWTFQALSYLFDIYFEEELDTSLVSSLHGFLADGAFWSHLPPASHITAAT